MVHSSFSSVGIDQWKAFEAYVRSFFAEHMAKKGSNNISVEETSASLSSSFRYVGA